MREKLHCYGHTSNEELILQSTREEFWPEQFVTCLWVGFPAKGRGKLHIPPFHFADVVSSCIDLCSQIKDVDTILSHDFGEKQTRISCALHRGTRHPFAHKTQHRVALKNNEAPFDLLSPCQSFTSIQKTQSSLHHELVIAVIWFRCCFILSRSHVLHFYFPTFQGIVCTRRSDNRTLPPSSLHLIFIQFIAPRQVTTTSVPVLHMPLS